MRSALHRIPFVMHCKDSTSQKLQRNTVICFWSVSTSQHMQRRSTCTYPRGQARRQYALQRDFATQTLAPMDDAPFVLVIIEHCPVGAQLTQAQQHLLPHAVAFTRKQNLR